MCFWWVSFSLLHDSLFSHPKSRILIQEGGTCMIYFTLVVFSPACLPFPASLPQSFSQLLSLLTYFNHYLGGDKVLASLVNVATHTEEINQISSFANKKFCSGSSFCLKPAKGELPSMHLPQKNKKESQRKPMFYWTPAIPTTRQKAIGNQLH